MDKQKKDTKSDEQLKKIEEERDQYKDKYLRALADYHNFQKRAVEQEVKVVSNVKKHMIVTLLPFLDNLEKAEAFVKDSGLTMVKKHFRETLEREGLKELDLIGGEYDPYQAEAIEIVEGDQDNIVVDILEKGYAIGDDIIRPAKVKVSKKLQVASEK